MGACLLRQLQDATCSSAPRSGLWADAKQLHFFSRLCMAGLLQGTSHMVA